MRKAYLLSLICIFASQFLSTSLYAENTGVDSLRFPGDPTDHNVVFQFNSDDESYHKSVLFAVSELVKKYGDNINIVVTVFGKGIHVLAKKPLRKVSDLTHMRVKSLAGYGVTFHACGNTMKSFNWTKDDMLPFVEIVKVGAADLIELQEKGYSYISW